MNKQEQDKLWSELSEETKQEYLEKYRFHLADSKREMKCNDGGYDLTVLRSNAIVDELVNMFGSHNLNPKQIKTWEDVEKKYPDLAENLYKGIQRLAGVYEDCEISLLVKCDATLKIAKLIDLGYGGMVTEEEWKDANCRKYVIEYYPQDKRKFVASEYCIGEYSFIAFHTSEQRQEFWSHESNRKLVEMYYLM